MHAWNLACSHVGLWTLEHEIVADSIAEQLLQLFSLLFSCSSATVRRDLGATVTQILQQTRHGRARKCNQQLVLVLRLFKILVQTLRFDARVKHLMVCATKLANSTVALLLRDANLAQHERRSKTLRGCYVLLKFAESSLASIYSNIPSSDAFTNLRCYPKPAQHNDLFQPAMFVYTAAPLEALNQSQAHDDDVRTVNVTPEAGDAQPEVTKNGENLISVQLKGVKR